MSAFLDLVLAWLIDYYAAASIVLAAALAARLLVRQPAARMAAAWSACLGLVALAVLTALPIWPRMAVEELPAYWRQSNVGYADSYPEPVAIPVELTAEAVALAEPIEIPLDETITLNSIAAAEVTALAVPWSHVAAGAWLSTVALALGWVLLGHWRTSSLLRAAVKAPAWAWDELRAIVQRTAQNTNKGVPERASLPHLWSSRRVPSAVALGALSRQIILPESNLVESNRPAVRAALAHEWAHIRHGDLWLLAIERLLLPMLAVHPLYWWLRRCIRLDQELLADAAAAGDEPAEYAEALLAWARTDTSARHGLAALSMWEHPSTLSRRVAMILDSKERACRPLSRAWLAVTCALVLPAILLLSVLSLNPMAAQDEPGAAVAEPAELTKQPSDVPPVPRTSTVPVTQVQLELLVASVNRDKLTAAETTLEDAIAQATESRCRREAGLVVSEIKPEEVLTLIDGLKKYEAIKVLSRPQVITLDGREANVHVGGEVPLLRVEETVNGKHEQRVEYKEFGTLLMVRPKLDANEKEEFVRLDIVAEQANLVPPGEKAVEGAVPRDVPGLVSHKFTLTEDVKLGGTLLVAESPADKKQLRDAVNEQFLLIVTPQRAIRTVAAVYADPREGDKGEAARAATEAALQAATAAEPESGTAAAALLQREREARANETAQLKRQIDELTKELARLRDATGNKVVKLEFVLSHQDPHVVAEALSQILARSQKKHSMAIESLTVGPGRNKIVLQVEEKYTDDYKRAIEALDRPLGTSDPNDPFADVVRQVLQSRRTTRTTATQQASDADRPQPAAENPARQAEAQLAELDLAEAKLALERADKEWARIAQLQARGAISQSEVDQKQMELEHAKIQVQRAMAKMQAAAAGPAAEPASVSRTAASRVGTNQKTEVKLLELDLADAKLAVEEAEAELARSEQVQKQSPAAISEQEIRKYRFQAERAKIQVQRIMVRLEAAKGGEEGTRR